MANGETTRDIHLEILSRVGEKTDGSSPYHQRALTYLNKMYQKIISGASEFELDLGEPWPWAKSSARGIITLQPYFGTDNSQGFINCTFNSANGTFSTIPVQNGVNISLAGYWVNLEEGSEWYQILTHVAGTLNFTLDSVFNDQNQTNQSFIAILLDYTVNAVLTTERGGIQRFAAPFETYRNQTFDNDNEYKVYGVDVREMRRQYPLALIELGIPTRFAIMTQKDGVITVRFNKYTDIQTRVEYEYIPVPIDLTSSPESVPVLPREFRDVLLYGPMYWLAMDKNDSRAPEFKTNAVDLLKAMIMDARKKRDHIGRNKGYMVPRWDNVNQKKRILYT